MPKQLLAAGISEVCRGDGAKNLMFSCGEEFLIQATSPGREKKAYHLLTDYSLETKQERLTAEIEFLLL